MLQNTWYQMGRSLVSNYVHHVMRADIQLDQALPPGAKIIAVNHPSTTDPAYVTAITNEQTTILIKESVFKVPLFGRSLRMAGHVPVVAGNGKAALEEGIRLLREGRTVIIFPEGVISPEGGFHKAHTGMARLALATGAPVIPVGISLDYKKVHMIYSTIDGEKEPISWYMYGPYAITVGQPLTFHGSLDDFDTVRLVTHQIMQNIMILARRSEQRLLSRAARARRPLLPTALPGQAYHAARHGTGLAYRQAARIFTRATGSRAVQACLMFMKMYARQLGV